MAGASVAGLDPPEPRIRANDLCSSVLSEPAEGVVLPVPRSNDSPRLRPAGSPGMGTASWECSRSNVEAASARRAYRSAEFASSLFRSGAPGRGELLCPGGAAADTARPNSRDRGKLGLVDLSAAGLCRGSHLLENGGEIRHLAAHQRAAPVFIVVAVATNPSTWHYASRG